MYKVEIVSSTKKRLVSDFGTFANAKSFIDSNRIDGCTYSLYYKSLLMWRCVIKDGKARRVGKIIRWDRSELTNNFMYKGVEYGRPITA